MARGIIAINIDKDDELIAVRVTSGDDVIFLATRDGMAIRFEETYDPNKSGGLRPMGRNAGGNKGISLKKKDYVIGAAVTPSEAARNRKRLELAAKIDLGNGLEVDPELLNSLGLSSRSEAEGSASAVSPNPVISTGAEGAVDSVLAPKPASAPAHSKGKPAQSMVALVRAAIAEIEKAKGAVPLELQGDSSEKVVEAALPEAEVEKMEKLDKQLGLTACLILTVSENGFGKRTDVDAYRLQSRGGKGVINMRTTPKIGQVSAIQLVDESTELMVISQFGKIIRIDTKTIRAAGRATMGVKLLDLDDADKVAAAVTIPNEEKPEDDKQLVQ